MDPVTTNTTMDHLTNLTGDSVVAIQEDAIHRYLSLGQKPIAILKSDKGCYIHYQQNQLLFVFGNPKISRKCQES